MGRQNVPFPNIMCTVGGFGLTDGIYPTRHSAASILAYTVGKREW